MIKIQANELIFFRQRQRHEHERVQGGHPQGSRPDHLRAVQRPSLLRQGLRRRLGLLRVSSQGLEVPLPLDQHEVHRAGGRHGVVTQSIGKIFTLRFAGSQMSPKFLSLFVYSLDSSCKTNKMNNFSDISTRNLSLFD